MKIVEVWAGDGTFRKDVKDEMTFKLRLEDEEPQKAPEKAGQSERSEGIRPAAGKGWL